MMVLGKIDGNEKSKKEKMGLEKCNSNSRIITRCCYLEKMAAEVMRDLTVESSKLQSAELKDWVLFLKLPLGFVEAL